jgi:hypothetical protein
VGNALSVLIESAKIVFGGGIALECGAAIIFGGFGEIARETFAVFVEVAEKELGVRYILGGDGPKPGER